MASEMLGAAIAILKSQGAMALQHCATEQQIHAFESEHGFYLPSGYREWLTISDGGECFLPAGAQLYGVAHQPLIDAEADDRPDDRYIIIGALPSGDPILCKKGEELIAIYNHGAGRIEEDETYPNFCAFLLALPEILGIEA